MTRTSSLLSGAGLAALALAITLPAFAAGGSSSGGGNNTPTCQAGYVYDKNKQACVKSGSSSLDDKELYQQGHDLALAGRYTEALDALKAVKNQNDSMLLTMIGYATRKLGHFDEGLAYYRQALVLNPNNVNTREYLGEAYAEKGQLDLAKAELVKVQALCGTECEQYKDLSAAIAGKPDND